MAFDVGSAVGGLGSAVSSIFGGIGDFEEASAYDKAAEYSAQNAQLEKESTAIQMLATKRQIFQAQGATAAYAAGAGLAKSGSVGDLLREGAQQGSLQMQLVHTQGLINENAYLEQEAANKGMASAARAGGVGDILGGILKGVAGFL